MLLKLLCDYEHGVMRRVAAAQRSLRSARAQEQWLCPRRKAGGRTKTPLQLIDEYRMYSPSLMTFVGHGVGKSSRLPNPPSVACLLSQPLSTPSGLDTDAVQVVLKLNAEC